MCRVLDVSASGFYAWRQRVPSQRSVANAVMAERIRQIHQDSYESYGMPRVRAELIEQGVCISRQRVARLMRLANIRGISRRRGFTVTTRRDKRQAPASDLVKRQFQASGPNQLWVADMTYVPTWTGFLYLAVVRQMTECGLSAADAAEHQGVTPPTARKWLGRYLVGGKAALADASSRPAHSPRAIDPAKALLIVELRRRRMLHASIARNVGVSPSTVSRVLARAGLCKLGDLAPAERVVRYEREAPGELLHIDTKKLGRIVRPSHRVTGNRRDSVDGAVWETLFVAVDDHARLAFTAMHPDEKQAQAA
jgi:transposase-like protein